MKSYPYLLSLPRRRRPRSHPHGRARRGGREGDNLRRGSLQEMGRVARERVVGDDGLGVSNGKSRTTKLLRGVEVGSVGGREGNLELIDVL